MLPLNMLSERHLKQAQSHVQCLNDIRLAGQRVAAAGGLPPRHLRLYGLEPVQHLVLETLERRVEDVAAYCVELTVHLPKEIKLCEILKRHNL